MTPKLFDYVRIGDLSQLPPQQDDTIDVAVLDMNHGWPNVGHHALVEAVRNLATQIITGLPEVDLDSFPLTVRVLSFDVRLGLAVPRFDRERFQLFLGTGGPGHINPAENDGVSVHAQGIRENPAWEPLLYSLFESIVADSDVALIGVCHTFGVLCRWAGIAEPVLRGPEKGGKSTGLVPNVLSAEATGHPWFSQFRQRLPNGIFRVIDNRLFDLIPNRERFEGGIVPLAYEWADRRPQRRSLTMVELARDRQGEMSRILAVNHHPEIIDRLHLMRVLDEKLARGEVSGIWYRERAETLTEQFVSDDAEKSVALTSEFTLLRPIEFHLRRLILERLGTAASPSPAIAT